MLVVDFGLLGPLTVSDGARPVAVSAPRQRVLLATLLLSAGRVVSVDTLAEVLWDGEPPAGARGAMHSAIQRLRSALGPAGAGLIGTRPPGYVLQLGDSGFDVREFEVLAARGRAAAQAGAWAQAAGLLREALGLWRGEALADVPSQLLRQREAPPLEDLRLQVLAARIDADLALGRHDEVVAELRQLVAAHPLWEHFHAQLMLGLYRSGRQGDALAAYQDVRRVLAGELGVDPGPELRLLQQQILAADPALVLTGKRRAAARPASARLPARLPACPAPGRRRPASGSPLPASAGPAASSVPGRSAPGAPSLPATGAPGTAGAADGPGPTGPAARPGPDGATAMRAPVPRQTAGGGPAFRGPGRCVNRPGGAGRGGGRGRRGEPGDGDLGHRGDGGDRQDRAGGPSRPPGGGRLPGRAARLGAGAVPGPAGALGRLDRRRADRPGRHPAAGRPGPPRPSPTGSSVTPAPGSATTGTPTPTWNRR